MMSQIRSDWLEFLEKSVRNGAVTDRYAQTLKSKAFTYSRGGTIDTFYSRPIPLSFIRFHQLLDNFCEEYGYIKIEVKSETPADSLDNEKNVAYELTPTIRITWKDFS